MSAKKSYTPAGAATAEEFARWLGISRNNVAGIATDLGIARLGRKYPWHATVARVLGIAAGVHQIHDLIGAPLMTLAEFAEEQGVAADDLKAGIETGRMATPPMYVLGQRRRRFLRPQCLQFLWSSTWEQYDKVPDHAATLEELAIELGVAPAVLQQHLEDDRTTLPAHVVADGVTRYIRAHALKVFGPDRVDPAMPPDETSPASEAAASPRPPTSRGIFGRAAQAAMAAAVET